jgi:hypothetical protein
MVCTFSKKNRFEAVNKANECWRLAQEFVQYHLPDRGSIKVINYGNGIGMTRTIEEDEGEDIIAIQDSESGMVYSDLEFLQR